MLRAGNIHSESQRGCISSSDGTIAERIHYACGRNSSTRDRGKHCDLGPGRMREPNGTGTRAYGLRRRVDRNHPAGNPGPLQRLRSRRSNVYHPHLQHIGHLLGHIDIHRLGGADPSPRASWATTIRPAGFRVRPPERRLGDRDGDSWTLLAGSTVGIGPVHSESVQRLCSELHRQVGRPQALMCRSTPRASPSARAREDPSPTGVDRDWRTKRKRRHALSFALSDVCFSCEVVRL